MTGKKKEEVAESAEKESVADIMASFPSREELLIEDNEARGSPEPKKKVEEAPKEMPEKKFSAADVEMSKLEESSQHSGIVEDTATETPQRSKTEMTAMERGWKPKEEFDGHSGDWVSAREFNDRHNMLDKIGEQRQELNELKKGNQEMTRLLKLQQTDHLNERVEKLQQLKEQAKEDGDVEQAYEYETKYQETKEELEGFKEVELIAKGKEGSVEVPPEVKAFIKRNPWLESNKSEDAAMREYAIRKEEEINKQYPTWQLVTKLEEVERQVKHYFRDRFRRRDEPRLGTVEPKTLSPATDPSKITYDDLPHEAKSYVDKFYRIFSADMRKQFSKDDYAQQLLDTGAIQL